MSAAGPVLPRRTVLKAAGAGALLPVLPGLAGCDGNAGGGATGAAGSSSLLDLSFDVVERYRPFALLAPGFEQLTEHGLGRVTGRRRTDQVPPAPFVCVEMAVDEVPVGGLVAGLDTADGDHVLATCAPDRETVSIEVRRQGRTAVVVSTRAALGGLVGFAFVLCENQVTAVADTGSGWQPLLTDRDGVAAVVDLRVPATLARHRYCFGSASTDGEVAVRTVRAGPFGYTGLRDPHLVQRADGSAVVRDNAAYLTFTCAGMGNFSQAHWGVFTLDLADPTRLEQVAQLYSRRDGLLLGDHAGQLVLDGDRFVAGTSSWGDFGSDGVHVRHTVGAVDLLSGTHLLETEPLALPTALSSWDPSFTRIDQRWHVSFVESRSQDPFDFHPALAAGPTGSAYDTGLELVGVDDSMQEGEGPIIQQVAGTWYVLASDKDTESYPVYDLSLTRLGSLDAPYLASNIPHPQVVGLPHGQQLLVTFDGTQYAEDVLGCGAHGDVVVMASA